MAREVKKQSDLKGIKFGEDWIFLNWPDPPQEDFEKWEAADKKAREQYVKFSAYAEKEAEKSAKADQKSKALKQIPIRGEKK